MLISSKEASEQLGISQRRVQRLLDDGRIEGALRVGRSWVIPSPVRVVPGTRGPSGVAGRSEA